MTPISNEPTRPGTPSAAAPHPNEQGFDLKLVPEKLPEPLTWKTPRMIFVNSMSDLFHEEVPDEYVLRVVRVMELANWHTYHAVRPYAGFASDEIASICGSAAPIDPQIQFAAGTVQQLRNALEMKPRRRGH